MWLVRGRHVCREARGGWERFGCDSAIAVESALEHRLAQSTGRCVRVVTWAGRDLSGITCRDPAEGGPRQCISGIFCVKPVVLNHPNAATLNTVLHAVVTPNHKILFIAAS